MEKFRGMCGCVADERYGIKEVNFGETWCAGPGMIAIRGEIMKFTSHQRNHRWISKLDR